MTKLTLIAAAAAAGVLAASAAGATTVITYDFSITGGAGTADSPTLDLTWTGQTGGTGVEDRAGTWYFTDTSGGLTNGYANLRLDGGGPTGTAIDLGVNLGGAAGSPYLQFADLSSSPLFTYGSLSADGRPLSAVFPVVTASVALSSPNLASDGGRYTGTYTYTATCVQSCDSGGLASPAVGSATPEPAAWALMLVGFAGLGGALRSNRKALAA